MSGLSGLPAGFLVWALLFFVLGYLLYASVLGAIGAPEGRDQAFGAIFDQDFPAVFERIAQEQGGDVAKLRKAYREIARKTAVFVAQKAEDFSAKFPSIVIQNT